MAPESQPGTHFHASIDETLSGVRIDKALADLNPDLSRARARELIETGQVRLNGAVSTNASLKIRTGDELTALVPPPRAWHPEAEAIALDVIYEDDDLLVINKQAGLVVHPGAGNKDGTLVNALLHHCGDTLSGIGGILRPGILHRLDKDTTGLLLVAKNDAAHRSLSEQLQDRTLSRRYIALVLGVPTPPKGVIDKAMGRHQTNRLKMSVGIKNGKTARTHYKILKSFGTACSLVECALDTGRTHQIRVHMASIKHPVIGDPLYGVQTNAVLSAFKKGGLPEDAAEASAAFPRQALHAWALSFEHPATGEIMEVQAPLPPDMAEILRKIDKSYKF